uniref:cDNA clone:002-139-C07, full insert sequence n=1 Tax=Oryza sativa subsp. japonica TaxID=39947 RepID=B7F0Z1_ORYSJ|nr:unnamed protein product [Oryza sativa Japonica Group]
MGALLPAPAPAGLPAPADDVGWVRRRLQGGERRSQEAGPGAAVGAVAGAAAEPRAEGRRAAADSGRARVDAQGAGGGVRRRRQPRRVAEVRGAGGVLQPPHVRGASEGGRGGVRLPAPRRHHHPLRRVAVRARRRRGGRREEGVRQVVASGGGWGWCKYAFHQNGLILFSCSVLCFSMDLASHLEANFFLDMCVPGSSWNH